MSLTVALLVSAGMSIAGGLIKGYAQNEADKNRQKEIDLQLTQTKQSNAYNALASASQNLLATQMNARQIDSQIAGFNAQIDQYATQATQATGALNARAGMTGFRNSGSNMNAVANQAQSNRFNISYLNSNIANSMNQMGASSVDQFNSYSSRMAGYKMNIDQAIASRNLQVENLGVAENYAFSKRMWSDVATSAINWGISTASSWAGSEMADSVAKASKKDPYTT